MKILMLSDFHIGNENFDMHKSFHFIDRAYDAISGKIDYGETIVVLICGDIIDKGNSALFSEAEKIFDHIRNKFSTLNTAPDREGYVFSKWDKTFTNVTSNMIVTAQYTKITNPTFVVGNVSASAGQTVTVPVSIVNNPGLLGIGLKVTYDDSALTLKKGATGSAVSEVLTFTPPKNLVSGCKFGWDGLEISQDQTKDGQVLLLTFEVTEIPANAFKNCTALKFVNAAGIKKIGSNAFAGCTSMEELTIGANITSLGTNIVSNKTLLTVSAANKSIVEAAVNSGAKEVYLRVTDKCTDLNNSTLTIPSSMETFTINGFGKTYNNLRIVSNAKKTIINRMNFVCDGQTPLTISSPNVELHETTIKSPGICLALTADKTNLALRGECELTASTGNSMLCKQISLSQIDPALATSLKVNGNLLIATSEKDILSGKNLLKVTGKIVGITVDEFNKYLKGVFTVSFNANEGVVNESSKTVVYGST